MKAAFVLVSGVVAEQPTWAEWKTEFGREYNGDEDALREGIFNDNAAFVTAENAKDLGYTVALNQFADLTLAEFKANYLTRKPPAAASTPVLSVHEHNGESLASSVNWVTKGAVTPVKDQGSCGGCWSFAATGSLEGQWQLASGSLTPLSEQQFLDCDKTDSGCGGGLEYDGWTFFKNANEGICTESSYPYKAKNGVCQYSSCTLGMPAGSISGVTHVATGSNSALMSAVNGRPVAIGIQADQSAFQLYSSGVLTGTCGKQLDHSVLTVGYDSAASTPYWLVKNSWGGSWGANGYLKIVMDSSDKCGILDDASYPLVSASELV